MFSSQPRFNWWFGIEAVTADGAFELPVPLQGDRTLAQRSLFDFREAKFHLNLYSSESLRDRYARYLCRQFPIVNGQGVRAVSSFIIRNCSLRKKPKAEERT